MSYVDELDLLFEATGPTRRDFNKSVAAAASSNILPSADLPSGVVSAGAKVVGTAMPELASVLNAVFMKTSPYYRLLNSIGAKKIKEVYDLLINNKDLTVSQLAKSEPAAKLFRKSIGHGFANVFFDPDVTERLDDNEGHWGRRDIGQTWTFLVNNDLPKGMIGYHEDENLDREIFSQIDNMLSAKPALMQEVAKSFGGFDKYLKYVFDSCAKSKEEMDQLNIMSILVQAKEHQPELYNTLGLKTDPDQVWRWLKNSVGPTKFHDENAAKAFSVNRDFLIELREKGILNAEYDEVIAKITNSVSKFRRLAKHKAGQEYDRENRRREKNYDDEALNRWEDEGGALGSLDEAIRKLLSIMI